METEQPIDLCERTNSGITTILYWMRSTNICSVYIEDISKNTVEQFVVPNDRAMDAYYHPYMYVKSVK